MKFASKEEAQAFVDQYQTDRIRWVLTLNVMLAGNGGLTNLNYWDEGWKYVDKGTPVRIETISAWTKPPDSSSKQIYVFAPNSLLRCRTILSPISNEDAPLVQQSMLIFNRMSTDYHKMRARQDLTE